MTLVTGPLWGEVGELRMGLPAWHPCLSTPDFLEIKVWEVSLYPES